MTNRGKFHHFKLYHLTLHHRWSVMVALPSSIIMFVLAMGVLGVIPDRSHAERLESESYVIQFGNFNMTAGKKTSGTGSYTVTDTVGQTGAGPFGQYGSSSYFVGSGFQYIYQISTFGFSISRTAIDLGELTPGIHNTGSHTVTIRTKGAGGYTLYAYELYPLRHSNGTDTIPDTTCDAGDCTQIAAGVWVDQDIPGFGFNVTGTDKKADFVDNTYFRQFANDSASEAMQPIMSSTDVADNSTGTITYKAGVSGTTAAGNYQTGVVFVAVPGY